MIYKIKTNSKQGFTLIELLVVITIIGVLATIVLNSLNSSRARAYDSKIKQQLARFRSSAEIYYSNQSPTGYYNSGTLSVCTTAGTIFTDVTTANAAPGSYILATNLPANTTVVCGANQNAYAVKATMYSGGAYWCVDSTGASKQVTGAIGGSVTVCP